MGHPVSIGTPSGRITGWRCDPPFRPHGALIVVQEIFGVNGHIRHLVDRFAHHGFIAIAPAFFDHIAPHIELGYNEEGVARGRELVNQIGFERCVRDISSLQRELSSEAAVGVVGYCWGGTLAYLANTRFAAPAVSYYGARTMPFIRERLQAPMEFHFGREDPLISAEDIQQHRENHPDARVYTYPAGHGFNCDERADYDPNSASEAMDRTINFFTRVLRS